MFAKTKTKRITFIKKIKEKITIITLKQQSNNRDKIPIILGGAHKEKVKRNKKDASARSAKRGEGLRPGKTKLFIH